MTQPTPAPLSAQEIELLRNRWIQSEKDAGRHLSQGFPGMAEMCRSSFQTLADAPRLLATIDTLQAQTDDMHKYLQGNFLVNDFQEWKERPKFDINIFENFKGPYYEDGEETP